MKKGIYVIHFENDDKNVYKIGYTSNLDKRLKQFKTSHVGKIDVVRFYIVTNNPRKVEDILHWRLRKNRIYYNQEFFKLDDLDNIDLICNDIIPIINDGLYPSKESTEKQLRLFVTKILGGVKEDKGDNEGHQDDTHMRFDFSGRCESSIIYNQSIITILKDWKLLFKASNFEFATAEGNATWWLTLKSDYLLNYKPDYMSYYLPPKNEHYEYENYYEYFSYHFQYEDVYVINFLKELEKENKFFEYSFDCACLGTITIIVDIIRTITLSDYYKKK